MTQTALVTADELFAMPEECRYELVKGVLVPMSPSPGFEHGETGALLMLSVGGYVRANHLGRTTAAETGFRLRRDPDTVRGPDFAFVARGRITPEMDRTRYLDLAPDLVAEVVSPSDSAGDVMSKVLEYLDAGVRLVLVLYPRTRSIVIHGPAVPWRLLRESDELTCEDVLPGFRCRVADLFPQAE